MENDKLQAGMVAIHTKHNTSYTVLSAKCRYKDSVKGWVDAVCYSPLYPNEYDCFMREKASFLEEFEERKETENICVMTTVENKPFLVSLGHTHEEWDKLEETAVYEELWDFPLTEVLDGTIEPADTIYWLIDNRLYETPYYL